ncbi:HNH endonuclease [Galactobacter valiniphilus]|uniref:HNH endonuclease n=1 Tax=Galactobacter valiniphilus TaxID=2676122 RepID=A0A399J7A6_9MICC|nr:HNH endonuclease [Galactobacter valiniphilus]RII41395.1 HNH endonuclease [Galactobacter valiniphilus]
MADQPFGRETAPAVLALRRVAAAPPEEFAAVLSPAEERAWTGLLARFLADWQGAQVSQPVRPAPEEAEPRPEPVSPSGRAAAVESLGAAAQGASVALATVQEHSASLTPSELRDALSALGALTRTVAGLQTAVARELLVRPPSTSAGPLHKQLGYPSVRVTLEHVLGLGTASAHALVDIAESTAPRQGFSAGELPPRYPVLAEAVQSGEISAEQARTITQGLPSDHRRLDPEALAAAEAALVGAATAGAHGTMPEAVAEALNQAGRASGSPGEGGSAGEGGAAGHDGAGGTPGSPGTPGGSGAASRGLVTPVASGRGSLDAHRLRPVALRDQAKLWAAFLDPDGLEPDERKQRQARYLHLTQQANGMWRLSGLAPAFEGAQFKTLLDAMTSPSAQRETAPSPEQGTGPATDAAPTSAQAGNDGRTAAQRRFDALAAVVARYAAGSDAPSVGGAAPTLLVLTTATAFAAAAGDDPTEATNDTAIGSPEEHPPGQPPAGAWSPPVPSGGFWSPPRADRSECTSGEASGTLFDGPSGDSTGHAPPSGDPSKANRTSRPHGPSLTGGPDETRGSPAPPPSTWAAPEHTGLGPDPDDPFDPRNFAGAGWTAEWNQASDSWAGDNAPADEPDPFDPATFADRGWGALPEEPAAAGSPSELDSDLRQAPGRSPALEGPAGQRAPALPNPQVHAPSAKAVPIDPLRAVLGVAAWMPHTQQLVSLTRVAHLVCGGAVQFMASDEAGHPLRLGRAQRLFSTHQRKALMARDLHCQAPGCALPAAFCEAHHLDPWRLGGPTDVEQAVLLCPFHHHLAHQEHGL